MGLPLIPRTVLTTSSRLSGVFTTMSGSPGRKWCRTPMTSTENGLGSVPWKTVSP
jgi:hypothetical protein